MLLLPADQVANKDVFITDELNTRVPDQSDYLQEKLALQELAACMADHPNDILPRLVDLALRLTGAVSGGLSLHEPTPGTDVFRWHSLRGALAPFDGATTPRNYSPCGITLDHNAPVLVQKPERLYTWLVDAGVGLPEVLLVPLYIGGSCPLGTLWVVSEQTGHFNSAHARVLTELAAFVDIALRMVRGEESLRKALDEQELLTREMNHRVQNVFAVVDSLIRSSKRGATTLDEMADVLLGRLHALNRAHGLVRSAFAEPRTATSGSDLETLIRAIVEPHDGGGDGPKTISAQGPLVHCGERATTAIALIIHELATNAAKYGALSVGGGRISVSWRTVDNALTLLWQERGGPTIGAAPEKLGFGSKLVQNTVDYQLGGQLAYDWPSTGLVLEMQLPLEALAH